MCDHRSGLFSRLRHPFHSRACVREPIRIIDPGPLRFLSLPNAWQKSTRYWAILAVTGDQKRARRSLEEIDPLLESLCFRIVERSLGDLSGKFTEDPSDFEGIHDLALVANITSAYRRGVPVDPPIVLWDKKQGATIADGTHRLTSLNALHVESTVIFEPCPGTMGGVV